MKNIDEEGKNSEYFTIIFLVFIARTVVLGSVLFKGPYFEVGDIQSFKIFSIILDVTNIFQLIFMFDVIQAKNIFQLLLYIPILAYSLIFSSLMISTSRDIYTVCRSRNLYIAIGFLYVYVAILAAEVVIHIFMYNRLKNDFKWFSFKKVGVNPIINGKVNNNFRGIEKEGTTQCCEEILHNGLLRRICELLLYFQYL